MLLPDLFRLNRVVRQLFIRMSRSICRCRLRTSRAKLGTVDLCFHGIAGISLRQPGKIRRCFELHLRDVKPTAPLKDCNLLPNIFVRHGHTLIVKDATETLVTNPAHRHERACNTRDLEATLEQSGITSHVRGHIKNHLALVLNSLSVAYHVLLTTFASGTFSQERSVSRCVYEVEHMITAPTVETDLDLGLDPLNV